ncbi:single-stranded-DNA-specific exonuclease RecJ [Nitrospirillum iridis]|uniref:Single-stranded-DNA-specific exonuclease RecJ n=1 Tax=Nitrospirillum iridis TaxID=765888 RepID=A0A7X0B5U8_9PROT|nr:single-stranded-DNA-specific exonuclease RecJ [Nitrospirillum iridis]MBB6254754.1 single-stranded-DNA-specific exonuclease [Nitrospirillum iridis]
MQNNVPFVGSPAGDAPGGEPRSLLGVSRSATGRRWLARPHDERLALAHAQRGGLPELVGRVLAARGVGLDQAEDFLAPTLKRFLPDPHALLDMRTAAERLADAVRRGRRLAVFGDYDVDGATSSALLVRFFRWVGADIQAYIPDRISEGYGPNAPALLRLREAGVDLVVTVDCGVTSFEPLAAAAQAGLEVIVVDHHKAEPALPTATAVVNPNRLDETMTDRLGTLAAVGVSFLLVVAVNRALRAAGWYGAGRPEPDLMAWLDLVALGTVCDVVPLVGLNRALVAQGLKVMGRRDNPGIAALADVAGVNERMDAYHAGYILGPRVNAGGRVGRADLGTRLLSTDDPVEARDLADQLHTLNAERRAIEALVLEEAIAMVEATAASPGAVAPGVGSLLVAGAGWHPGVIGIVASRLKDRYGVPACVVALDGGVGKASGRSVRGVDLGSAVIAARQAGLLVAGGGHAMAAGFTVAEDRLPELRAFMAERIAQQLAGQGPLVPTLHLDGVVSVRGASTDLLAHMTRLGPFGTGNSEPRLAVADARIVRADVVGGNHVRCILSSPDGARLKAIAFRAMDEDLGPALLNHGGRPLHLAGTLRADRWNGAEGVQLMIDDAAVPGGG